MKGSALEEELAEWSATVAEWLVDPWRIDGDIAYAHQLGINDAAADQFGPSTPAALSYRNVVRESLDDIDEDLGRRLLGDEDDDEG